VDRPVQGAVGYLVPAVEELFGEVPPGKLRCFVSKGDKSNGGKSEGGAGK